MFFRKHFSACASIALMSCPIAALATPAYKVAFAPAGFTGAHINNEGKVVGTSNDAAAIWSGRTVTDISAIAPGSEGVGINDRGQIAGIVGADFVALAFVRGNKGVRQIRLAPPWDEYSRAVAVNNAGQVAGTGNAPVGEAARGFLYTRGTVRLIGTFGGDWSYAEGMNSSGHVVGTAAMPDQQVGFRHAHAFLYRDGVLKDIGTLGGRNSSARDINDSGQIVGESETTLVPDGETSARRAFLYERGKMRDLGSLGGLDASAWAINNAGVIVGEAGTAFVYANGRMTDLNTRVRLPAGFTLSVAYDINDGGQILARACRLDDCNYWARLTPRTGARMQGDTMEDDEEE